MKLTDSPAIERSPFRMNKYVVPLSATMNYVFKNISFVLFIVFKCFVISLYYEFFAVILSV